MHTELVGGASVFQDTRGEAALTVEPTLISVLCLSSAMVAMVGCSCDGLGNFFAGAGSITLEENPSHEAGAWLIRFSQLNLRRLCGLWITEKATK